MSGDILHNYLTLLGRKLWKNNSLSRLFERKQREERQKTRENPHSKQSKKCWDKYSLYNLLSLEQIVSFLVTHSSFPTSFLLEKRDFCQETTKCHRKICDTTCRLSRLNLKNCLKSKKNCQRMLSGSKLFFTVATV